MCVLVLLFVCLCLCVCGGTLVHASFCFCLPVCADKRRRISSIQQVLAQPIWPPSHYCTVFIYVYCMRLSSQLFLPQAARERCSTSQLTVKQRSPSSRRTDGSATTVCLTPRPHRTSVPPHWATFSSLPSKRIKRGFSVQNKSLIGEVQVGCFLRVGMV